MPISVDPKPIPEKDVLPPRLPRPFSLCILSHPKGLPSRSSRLILTPTHLASCSARNQVSFSTSRLVGRSSAGTWPGLVLSNRNFAKLQAGRRVTGPLKSTAGLRVVAVLAMLVDVLKAHYRMGHASMRAALIYKHSTRDLDHVFCHSKRDREPPDSLQTLIVRETIALLSIDGLTSPTERLGVKLGAGVRHGGEPTTSEAELVHADCSAAEHLRFLPESFDQPVIRSAVHIDGEHLSAADVAGKHEPASTGFQQLTVSPMSVAPLFTIRRPKPFGRLRRY